MTTRQELIRVMKKHGQYFTPKNIIKAIVNYLAPSDEHYAVDPGCGDGGFLEYLAEKGVTNIHGFDIDQEMIAAATRRVGEKAHITQRDVLDEGLPQQYDVIVANPPFSPDRPDTAKNFSTRSKHPAAQFTELCIRSFTPCGRMAIILDGGLCTNQSYRMVRQKISELADIEMIVELSASAFEKVAGTTFTTYVVFFRPRGAISHPVFVTKDGRKIWSNRYQKELANGDWIPIVHKDQPECESTLGDFMELVSEKFQEENDRCPCVHRETRMLVDSQRVPRRVRRCVRDCLFLSRHAPGKSLPRCAPITAQFHGAGTTSEYFIIRPRKGSDLAWLWYVINFTDEVRQYLNRAGRGQGRKRVSPEDFLLMPLAKPSEKFVNHAKQCFAKAHELNQQYQRFRQDVEKVIL